MIVIGGVLTFLILLWLALHIGVAAYIALMFAGEVVGRLLKQYARPGRWPGGKR